MLKTIKAARRLRACTLCLWCALWACQQVNADNLSAAHHLLQIADVRHHFEMRTAQQVKQIIRSYSSIVSMTAKMQLPDDIKQRINSCYAKVYAWDNFEAGIAQILADNLTPAEIQLLTDFYGNLGLPPMAIEQFKQAIAKSEQIQESTLEYMWASSDSCIEHDAALILQYVDTTNAAAGTVFATD